MASDGSFSLADCRGAQRYLIAPREYDEKVARLLSVHTEREHDDIVIAEFLTW
jgi:hypothetical protein